jgi:hypothetical protein
MNGARLLTPLASKLSTSTTTGENLVIAGNQQQFQEIDLKPPRGTRDFYPPEMRLQTWLFNQWRQVAKLYNFEEYDAPVLENEQLFIRKAGEEVTKILLFLIYLLSSFLLVLFFFSWMKKLDRYI